MKWILTLEEIAQLLLAIVALYLQPVSVPWWLWPILFLSPDISMIGYLVNTKVGAFTYNLFHHKGVAIVVGLMGYFLSQPILVFAGLILFGHSAFDRIFGFGLKYSTGFKTTHLGDLK